jgi:NAD+ kinase
VKIGIYGRALNQPNSIDHFRHFLKVLEKKNVHASIYHLFDDYLKKDIGIKTNLEKFSEGNVNTDHFDYIICVGGDGTMLDTLMIVKGTGIPVLGINMGRFGFLASTQSDNIDNAIEELTKKSFSIDRRSILKLESSEEIFGGFNYALNDFVLHKRDSSSMITVHTYLNGEFMNSYWADGLIISTPTGSSGYSLSCGGPLLFPRSASFAITPIAPHNLNARPVVIPDDNILSFEIEGRSTNFLASLDSRSATFGATIQMAIKKAEFTFNMVRLSGENYLDTLRNKLMWGIDNRN